MRMTSTTQIITFTLALWAGLAVLAQAKLEAGPNGGKLIGTDPDRAELVIRDDGKVAVSFLAEAGTSGDIGERLVTLFAQLGTGRTEITLVREGETLVSEKPLPQPEGYTLVVQIRSMADAKPVNARVQYISHICDGCSFKEYACTCEDH